MKSAVLVIISLMGLGCGENRLRTSIPPPDPRCATEAISSHDKGRLLANFAGIGPSYAKSPYYVGNSSDVAYGFVDSEFPWVTPDSAICMRLTVARSPRCPTSEGSLDCRIDWYWWQMNGAGPFGTAIRRIQYDQQSCRLNSLYEEFLSFPHTDEEKAAVCLGMLMHDPEMHPCLEQNKAALRRLAGKRQRNDRQTYATLLYNSFFMTPLWTDEYTQSYEWMATNLLPRMKNRTESPNAHHYAVLSATKAFRAGDREGLIALLIDGTSGAGYVVMDMLFKLGLRGDEAERFKRLGASQWVQEAFNSGLVIHEKSLREGHDPFYILNRKVCSVPPPERIRQP